MKKPKSLKVLIVDDNEAYRAGLVEFLQHEKGLEIVGQSGSADNAIYLTRSLNPDLVLMDISMPGTNGLEAARAIKSFSPSTKIVFVTIHKEETYRALGDLLGVEGFVYKDDVKEGLRKVLSSMIEIAKRKPPGF